tara:strand:- start:13393 stop:13791 length:399 start_codon:yes stop_codon:yes gene_type:complete
MGKDFTIGKLSSQTGVNIETIRYYEKEGILPAPPRTEGGHRLYSEEHLRRLTFVRRSRELGFSLNEIRTMLDMVDGGNLTCSEVKDVTVKHLENVRDKISDLQKLEKTLKAIASQCKGNKTPDCPIIDSLFS